MRLGLIVKVKPEYQNRLDYREETAVVVRHEINRDYRDTVTGRPAVDNVIRFVSGREEPYFDHELEVQS